MLNASCKTLGNFMRQSGGATSPPGFILLVTTALGTPMICDVTHQLTANDLRSKRAGLSYKVQMMCMVNLAMRLDRQEDRQTDRKIDTADG